MVMSSDICTASRSRAIINSVWHGVWCHRSCHRKREYHREQCRKSMNIKLDCPRSSGHASSVKMWTGSMWMERGHSLESVLPLSPDCCRCNGAAATVKCQPINHVKRGDIILSRRRGWQGIIAVLETRTTWKWAGNEASLPQTGKRSETLQGFPNRQVLRERWSVQLFGKGAKEGVRLFQTVINLRLKRSFIEAVWQNERIQIHMPLSQKFQ